MIYEDRTSIGSSSSAAPKFWSRNALAVPPLCVLVSVCEDGLDRERGIRAVVGGVAGSFGWDEISEEGRWRSLGSLVGANADRAPESVFWRVESM